MMKDSNLLRGVIPATYVTLLYDYLKGTGYDPERLLGAAALDNGQEPLHYPVAQWKDMLERCADELRDPLLSLHLGQTITPAHFGVLGYVMLSCADLRGVLDRIHRYQRLIYDVNLMTIRTDGDRVDMCWGVEQGRPGALVDETAIVAMVQFCRDITGNPTLAPRAVEFVNTQPESHREYEAYFRCPVRFDQAQTCVRLDTHWLSQSLRASDPTLAAVLEHQAEIMLAELPPADSFITGVRKIIAYALQDGEPTLQSVSEGLHISPRTLHRRLDSEGWNFRRLLNDIRGRMAQDYLRDPRLQISEIAMLLGYSEQSAFSRAYSRWAKQSPLAFRKASIR